MKITVIGCTHAGTAAILNANKLYPEADISVYEKNDNISFLSCGIALHVGGVVKDDSGLFYSSPDELSSLGVDTKMRHEVINADLDQKILKVKDLDSGKIFEDKFDKLIISTGSWPVIPSIEGIDNKNILLCKNYDHSKAIIDKGENAKRIIVVGAGYIGVELVEAFQLNGKEVTLIDAEERILSRYLDKEYTDPAEKTLSENGIKLALGEKVNKFSSVDGRVKGVVTDKGEYEADLVILCIGFKPNTSLFSGQIKMLDNGAILVDKYMRTSKDDIFAAGDSCAVKFNPTQSYRYIPLATNAVRMGTLAAKNLLEGTTEYMGTQGTSGIKIYGLNIASTGLTETGARAENLDVKSAILEENHRPEFMPGYEKVMLKIVYNRGSRVVLGAQLISKMDLTQAINTISICIQNRMTLEQLAFTDFFFQPHYNKPWNFINQAAISALV